MYWLKHYLFLICLAVSSNAITIDSVITLSDSCVQIQWTPDSNNTNPSWYEQYSTLCTGLDSIYKHCDFIAGRNYTGIAYSYGGEDPWTTFRSHLLEGYLAGSHQCHYEQYGDPSNKIAGTDCSGFLSFVWNYPRVATSVFYSSSSFITIPISEVRPGDALVKATASCGNHAVLIIEADDLTEAVISEATSVSFGCRERVVDLTSSAWNCYKAIRYPQLENSPVKSHPANSSKNFIANVKMSPKGHIAISMNTLFSGTIAGYLPDGTMLFSKNIDQSVATITLKIPFVKSNTIILELRTATQRKYYKVNIINM